jgi:hypothetical protein
MNEKIDKIKRQFTEQTHTVETIKKAFDENLSRIET